MSDAPSPEAESAGEDDAEDDAEAADDTAAGEAETVDLDFGETGRIPAVAQDADTGEVLMLAYVTAEAVERTRETGLAHYYSRSREELWQKGATSGHVQRVREVRVDCDGDALLYLVDQEGGACHTGYESCFYRTLDGEVVGEKAFDPEDVYE
ncbi:MULTISPECIES: phosphoribosyl-AMP cyclohydrolase [Halorussus]|uniref:phosphoribosyl-AMP cyclohydrolase n=1 Tax=Halorussus TaxID=1070314 RepID=UPI000E216D3D|nr:MULTISPECIES: phosphoribosyl-AMP cyclohydrolase [Halorussus]NHN60763.1 phosphoribosyl-AMP cyclohydrolase [Halorussus sp. JP-T4]